MESSTTNENKFINRVGNIIALAAVGAMAFVPAKCAWETVKSEKAYLEHYSEIADIGRESIMVAAGEDRILSYEEKREFLDEIGLTSTVLQGEEESLYIEPFIWSNYDGAYVVLGKNLENNGGILPTFAGKYIGRIRGAGTSLGFVPKERFENYIEKNK